MFDESVKRDRSVTENQDNAVGRIRAASTSIVRRRGIRRSATLAPVILLAVLLVTLFPSAAVSGTVTTTLNPTADAYVNQATPTTNYGSALVLNAGASPTMRSYLKFVIPRLNNTTIGSATLRLYANTSSTAGVSARSAGNSWAESTIRWNGSPGPGGIVASSGPVTAGTWVELNVRTLVASNSTRTIALTGTGVPALALASREDTDHQPQLVINVNDTTAPAPTLTVPGNNARTGPLPTFSGRAGTAVGDLPTVTVNIYPGSTPTGTPVQTLTTTATGNTWSVSGTTGLANGTYTARAEQSDNAGNTGLSGARVFRVIPVIVSIMFDDGTENQYQARAMLAAHGGMDATFFVNSSVIGSNPFYMTWEQLNDLYTDGSEIAGHTMFHADLTASDPNEAMRQVCYDRNKLLAHGFPITDFAYPFGSYNDSTKAMVQSCGYNSGRGTESFEGLCAPLCSESIPPADPYATRVAGYGPDGLAVLQSRVTDAERNGGGWVQLLFHGLCTGCGVNGTDPATFNSFLNWLQPRGANGATVVRTVQQVIGGTVQPAVPGPPLPAPPNGTNVITNSSLEQDTNGDGTPDCYRINSWGNHTAAWTRTTDAHTGTYAERVDSTNYVDGADIMETWDDLGYCTPTMIPGHQYTISTWYKSTAPVRYSTNTRDDVFSSPFPFWTESTSLGDPPFPASSDWAQATWTTPPVPAGVSGLLFGLMLTSEGSLTVDDVSIVDANPTP
jgi:peptidoglycan/xylan/chitin deacetylase (PgdA/CDA1 family)